MLSGCNGLQASRGKNEVEIEGNGGFAVSDGETVYYFDRGYQRYGGPIRRVAADNPYGESEIIYEDTSGNLNLSKDGKLYFLSGDGISWIKPKEAVFAKVDLVEASCLENLVLSGDWIYFYSSDYEQAGEYPQGIYRVDVNTSAVELVVDGRESRAGYCGFKLFGDFLYCPMYGAEQEQGFGLMKFDINSGESVFIIKFKDALTNGDMTGFQITDKYIYCDLDYGFIKRFDLNGQSEEVIYTEEEERTISFLFTDGEYVYFRRYQDWLCDLYRAKIDGTGKEKIVAGAEHHWFEAVLSAGKIFVHFIDQTETWEGESAGVYFVDRDGKNGFKLQ